MAEQQIYNNVVVQTQVSIEFPASSYRLIKIYDISFDDDYLDNAVTSDFE